MRKGALSFIVALLLVEASPTNTKNGAYRQDSSFTIDRYNWKLERSVTLWKRRRYRGGNWFPRRAISVELMILGIIERAAWPIMPATTIRNSRLIPLLASRPPPSPVLFWPNVKVHRFPRGWPVVPSGSDKLISSYRICNEENREPKFPCFFFFFFRRIRGNIHFSKSLRFLLGRFDFATTRSRIAMEI